MASKPIRHNGGIIRKTPYGTWRAEYNRVQGPGRPQKTHKTQEAAREWIDRVALEARLDLDHASAQEMADAAEARRILDGRASLTEAAHFWLRQAGTLHPITVEEAVAKYLDLRDEDNVRPRSLNTTRHRLKPLRVAYPEALLHTLTTDELRATLKGSPTTRNNYRRYYIAFWNWAVKADHALQNVAEGLTIAEADESLPEALTLPQVARLLKTTQEMDPDLLPWLCTGLFAGLRSAELDRVTADHFKGARLHLDPSVTKLRDRRVLDLLPVLQEWLQAYPPQGRLRQPAHYKRWTAIRKAAGVDPWPDNAIRHSFSTYHLAAFQDPAKTAHYTRHSNQTTLHRHYIDLATHDDGLKYFSLTPKALKKWKTES